MRFPRPTQQTRLLAAPAPRFWLFANASQGDFRSLDIRPEDVLVFLNRAKPFDKLKHLPNRRILIVRRNARDKNWFIPYGREKEIFSLYEDVQLLSDKALGRNAHGSRSTSGPRTTHPRPRAGLLTICCGMISRMPRCCWSISGRTGTTARTSGTSTIGSMRRSITGSTMCPSFCYFDIPLQIWIFSSIQKKARH